MLAKKRKILQKMIASMVIASIWSFYSSMLIFAAQTDGGIITVSGNVRVNGQPIISDATVISGSRIETGSNSTAVITINKVGKVELAPETSLTLRFSGSSMIGIIDSGKVTVFNNAGIATTFTTKDATVIADAGQANNFIIEVECSHTHVDTIAGLVTMRTGATDKQVAAGTDAVAGDMQQPNCKPCLRPGTVIPTPVAGIGAGALLALLLSIGGAVATGIILGTQGQEPNTSGSTTVVSPV